MTNTSYVQSEDICFQYKILDHYKPVRPCSVQLLGILDYSNIEQHDIIFKCGSSKCMSSEKSLKIPRGTFGSVASLLAETLYQGNPDRNHKVWNIVSTERHILHMQVLLE